MSAVKRHSVKRNDRRKTTIKKGMNDDVRFASAEGAPRRAEGQSASQSASKSPSTARHGRSDPRSGRSGDVTTAPASGTR
jgi:hypothetical protein